jgi:NTP pyrophosphatase (non-canonical NTP hydrolase)
MINSKNIGTNSIDVWFDEFAEIYGLTDIQRTPDNIWLMLMEDASKVAKTIRKEEYADALNPLAHVFVWTCAFTWRFMQNDQAVKIRKPFSEIVWYKYPEKCPYCGKSLCICPVRRDEIETLSKEEKLALEQKIWNELAIDRSRLEKIPKTLDGYVDMFKGVYHGAHYSLTVENIAFHFMEEVGEISSCIRKLREMNQSGTAFKAAEYQEEMEREIADIFSWTSSLLMKMDYILGSGNKFFKIYLSDKYDAKNLKQTANLKMSEIIWKAFKDPKSDRMYCPSCKNRPCKCLKEKRKHLDKINQQNSVL